jgi:uncharacterized phiE125 gp8 family phage protein
MSLYSLTKIQTIDTAPILTLADVKAHLRVDYTDEDALILGLIEAATDAIEAHLWRSLRLTSFRLVSAVCIAPTTLPNQPIANITSVQYRDASGTFTPIDAATYWLDADAASLRWKEGVVLDSTKEALVIEYHAGFDVIPASILQAAKLLIGHWYNSRESSTPERLKILTDCPFAVTNLLERYSNRSYVSM